MSTSVTVQEDIHNIWKTGSIISALLCIILFLLYTNMDDPFWTGILRLGAFVFFAVAILGGLKLMGSSLRVTLSFTDEFLLVTYQKNEKVVHEEQFKRETIKKIFTASPRGNLLYAYLQPSSKIFKVSFTDTSKDLYLFEFGGRPLLFDSASQQTITSFLKELKIDN